MYPPLRLSSSDICNPEIAEREDERAVHHIVPTYAELAENLLGEQEEGRRKYDGHNAGIVDFEREVGALPAHDFAPDNPLCILYGNFSDGLENHDDGSRDDAKEDEHKHRLRNAH